jgi:hypothetical protein
MGTSGTTSVATADGGRKGVRVDGSATLRSKLSPKQLLLIDWLVEQPGRRMPRTMGEWCRENIVNPSVAANWKRDEAFRAAWDRKMHEAAVSPDLEQEILDNLHAIATSQVKDAVPAAKLWISVAQEFRLSAPKADPTEALQDMSDEELEALIAAHAKSELAARNSENVVALRG